jgi:hypothetical protein
MGLFGRIFGNGGSATEPTGQTVEVESFVFEDCTEWVAAVGESHYQPALRQICGSQRWEDVRFECSAALIAEPDNRADPNAVAVYAGTERTSHLHVGYLSRGDALDYRAVIRKARESGYTIACEAHIAGRGPGSDTPNLGIWLELPLPYECLRQLGGGAGTEPSTGGGRVIPDAEMEWTRFDDCRRVSVVGFEFHQAGLLAASQGLVSGTDRFESTAELVLEPDNPHDPNAAAVMVGGHRIGYIKSGSAKQLHKRLVAMAEAGEHESYTVLVRGRERGVLQAHLQIPYSSKLLEGYKNRKRST